MVTVCKKWRVSYTEARKLVNDYDNGDVPFPRYAAIGPASNLCEALGERNSALHQGNDDQVVEPLTDYTNPDGHTVWQTVYNDIEHCLREQVSVEVNRFHSNIQQVISDQFNSSQCAGIVGEPYVSVGTEEGSLVQTVTLLMLLVRIIAAFVIMRKVTS
ncbi:uncharacterized protein [Dysidea avara]|uniref:uncharacterized protein isoform X2 n=1 Tax=Dysidea avara TaxID=196820 RepID=UPI003326F7CF